MPLILNHSTLVQAGLVVVMLAAGLGADRASADVTKSTNTREWNFRVFLDEKEIGFHDYRVIEQDGTRRVETEAHFDVKFLFVNAYRYRHRTVETWDANCLTGIDATTNANGDTLTVQGESRDDRFVVTTPESETSLPECVMSFAYWNPQMLRARRLLNAQTGELETITIARTREDSVLVHGEPVWAVRYDLGVKDREISLWYGADDGRWLALESPARGGRVIRYEPIGLPSVIQRTAAVSADDIGSDGQTN